MNREQLLEAARAGDRDALADLLSQCQPVLRRYARGQCSSSDVDDAVQDALWIVHERFRALKLAAALSSWLFHVVQRICWRMNRKADRLLPLLDIPNTSSSQNESIHLRLELSRVLEKLEASYREVLLLRDMYGYTNEETAHRLGISVEATKSRLHRARYNVRRSLSEERDRR